MPARMRRPVAGLALLFCFLGACATPWMDGIDAVDVVTIDEAAVAGPRVLVVVAHPDDEIAFAGVLYKTATLLRGACDVVTITNGEGGFKYATLAEPVYGLELTDPAVGRAALPAIRRAELSEGCRYLRVRRLFLLAQKDHRYTLDPREVLDPVDGVWDVPFVRRTLRTILDAGHYDFVLTLTPVEDTHGHHKAATLLALASVAELAEAERPIVLGMRGASTGESPPGPHAGLADQPQTAQRGPTFRFARAQPFGYNDRLNYKIIANWAIAAHKSQGTEQLLAGRTDLEIYHAYVGNPATASERASAWFDALAARQYPARSYDAADGGVPTGPPSAAAARP